MKYRIITTASLLLLVMVFAIQNSALVQIRLLFWQLELPRSVLIFTMLIVGMALGWIFRAMIKLSKAT